MIRHFTLCALLLLCASTPVRSQSIPQLVQGVYVDAVIDSVSYYSSGYCAPQMDFELWPDSAFLPIATGVELYALVTDLNMQFGYVASSYGNVAVGDTLPFDTTRSYPFTFAGIGNLTVQYRLKGTPTVPGEAYHCNHELALTLANCGNAAYLWTLDPNPACQVQPFNSISERLGRAWTLYPVPAQGSFQLRHEDGLTQWEQVVLRDLQGRKLRTWEAGEMLNAEGFARGVYLVEIDSPEGRTVKRLQIE